MKIMAEGFLLNMKELTSRNKMQKTRPFHFQLCQVRSYKKKKWTRPQIIVKFCGRGRKSRREAQWKHKQSEIVKVSYLKRLDLLKHAKRCFLQMNHSLQISEWCDFKILKFVVVEKAPKMIDLGITRMKRQTLIISKAYNFYTTIVFICPFCIEMVVYNWISIFSLFLTVAL